MATNNNQEDLLLALMSMGFEYENCRKVINDGITVLEEAVSRLLNPEEPSGSQQQQSNQQPVLSLSSSSFAGTSATSETQNIGGEVKIKSRYERQRKEQEEYERHERMASERLVKKQKMEDRKLKENLLKEIASDHRKTTPSASTSAEDDKERKRKEREEYEEKQKEQHAEQWKKMQRDKRIDRQRVLAAIEADKESKKHEGENKEKKLETDKPQRPAELEKKVMCRIQVNYPDNTHEVLSLSSDSELKELYALCKTTHHDGTDTKYVFVQTFPRRKFTSADFSTTLKDLGMCPSCRLNIQKDIPAAPSDDIVSAVATPELPVNQEEVTRQELPASFYEGAEEGIEEEPREAEELVEEEPTEEPVLKRPCLGSRLLQGHIDNEIDDDFIRTIDERHLYHDDRNVADPNVIEEAITRRLAHKTEEEDITGSRKLTSLQKAAAIYVAKQLMKKQPDIVHHISLLNPMAADFIVKALQRSNNLSSDLLNILQPCKLKEINFDLWRLAPQDLLYSLKSHHNLRQLSLKSVNCVSDRLVETIMKNARRISYLNLSDCENIVGIFLTSPQGLSRLKTLILSRTKVKDEYIRNFLRLEVAKELNELCVSNCPITNEAFDLDKDYSSMRVLSIDETQVDSLSFLRCFTNICSLNVRKTNITDKDMEYVAALQNLYALELQSTKISYEGLLHIRDKKLHRFSFPDRLSVDNSCIRVIEGFDLKVLDLTNFVNLDDGFISSLCKMKSLKHLYLSQILKLTDAGILQLKDLSCLETLNLRNTNVTSNIASLFQSLPQLHTLDLTGTKVENSLIPHLSNSCSNLVKLNMSHTGIDDEGIIHLQLPRLSVLTLDDTNVTSASLHRLTARCEMLSWIRNASRNFLYTSESFAS